jgi:hypothetical protein
MGIEEALVREFAVKISSRIVKSVVTRLQGMKDNLMSGDDSGLESIWEEICVQVQDEESCFYSLYEDIVEKCIADEVSALDVHEQIALWLLTDAGIDWVCDALDDEKPPFNIDDIGNEIRSDVISEAGDFENERIYNFIWNLAPEEVENDEDGEEIGDGHDENNEGHSVDHLDESQSQGNPHLPLDDAKADDAKEVISQLSEDFGPEFVKIIRLIAEKSAMETVARILAKAVK